MNKKKLVSVITVCYNSEDYIEETIKSVLNQSYNKIEYIIVDGKSKDNTLDIIRKYKNKYSDKLKYISEEDKGIYDAMNKGIKMSRGEIIGILNSGDWYDKNTIQKIVDNYNKNIDIYYGDKYLVNEENKKILKIVKGSINSLKERMSINHPTMFVKKDWYENNFLYDIKYQLSADYKFALKSYLKNANFQYLNYPLTFMRTGGKSKNIKAKWEAFLIQEELLNNKIYPIIILIKKLLGFYFDKIIKNFKQ